MGRFIIIIALGILVILLWLALAAGALLWLVFTPERLTPIVQQQLDRHMPYQSSVERVDLTFFSTFPRLSLQLSEVHVSSPFQGAPSDTLLHVQRLDGAIDVQSLRQQGIVVIHQFELKNGYLNLYSDSLGQSNFEKLLQLVPAEADEAIETALPLVELEHIRLEGVDLLYEDQLLGIRSAIRGLTAGFSGQLREDTLTGLLQLEHALVSVRQGDLEYLENAVIRAEIPAEFSLSSMHLLLDKASLTADAVELAISGSFELSDHIFADFLFDLKNLPVEEVIRLTPPSLLAPMGSFQASGTAALSGQLTGVLDPAVLPPMDILIRLTDGTLLHEWVPQPLSRLNGEMRLTNQGGESGRMDLELLQLRGRSPQSGISSRGRMEDLMGDVRFVLVNDVDLQLAEWTDWLPGMPDLHLAARVKGRAHTSFRLSHALQMEIGRMQLAGSLELLDLDVRLDTLGVLASRSQLEFALPNRQAVSPDTQFASFSLQSDELELGAGELFGGLLSNISLRAETSDVLDTSAIPVVLASFSADALQARADTMDVFLERPAGTIRAEPRAEAPKDMLVQLEYSSDGIRTKIGPHTLNTGYVRLETDIRQDSKQEELFLQWMAEGFMEMYDGQLNTTFLPHPVDIPSVAMQFDPETFNIYQSYFRLAQSDFGFSGVLNNVMSFARGDSLLVGDFRFESNQTDLAQLMSLTSGLGAEEADATGYVPGNSGVPGANEHNPGEFSGAGLRDASGEGPGGESVPPSGGGTEKDPYDFSGPYMVPQGVDLSLQAFVRQATLGPDTISDIRGDVRVSDGILVLDGLTFTTPAADMQLTAMYRTPRKNHLYLGIDYHMLDVDLGRLLEMIPDIDTLMPMLRSFEGSGEFHLAVETYLDSLYNIKKSTLRGAASIRGQDLVLMDGETFAEIARTLRFTRRAENRVDSLSAEFTIFREEIDVYPFLIVMDRYRAVVGGRHNFDMSFNYHISVVDSPLPFRLGVDVTGTMDQLNYRVTSARYAELYRPVARRAVESHQLELRRMIRDALITNIRE